MHARKTHVKRGFTLIEILIVVVILGILAAIIVPQFTNAAQDAGVSSARSQLQTLRSQVELYRVQNNGAVPADGYTGSVNSAGAGPGMLLRTPISFATRRSGPTGSSRSTPRRASSRSPSPEPRFPM